MHIRDLVVRPDAVPTYEPPGHTGTVNRRLVPPPGQRAGKLEIVLGVLQPGGEALLHAHADQDQAVYVLEGGCRVESEGEAAEVGPGQIVYFPARLPHRLTVTGTTALRLLVIYAPPLHR